MKYKTILVIPDTQFEPGKSYKHFGWAATLAVQYKVDAVVHLGDYNDHLGSSTFDRDIASVSVKRDIRKDYEVGFEANDLFQKKLGSHSPKLVLLRGNHDERPRKYAEKNDEVLGLIKDYENRFENMGWDVIPYQQPYKLSGVLYSHMFTRTANGRSSARSVKSGASSARAQLQANLCSVTAGHIPGFEYVQLPTEDGIKHSMIAGSFYSQKMQYAGPQGSNHFNGVIIKHMRAPGDYCYDLWPTWRLKQLDD